MWLENLHDFDREADDKIYMIVRMRKGGGKARYALLPLPVDAVGRWFVLPNENEDENVNGNVYKNGNESVDAKQNEDKNER